MVCSLDEIALKEGRLRSRSMLGQKAEHRIVQWAEDWRKDDAS